MNGFDEFGDRAVLTVEEAAQVLRIGRSSAFTAVRTGDIPSLRIGRRLLVPRAGLERLLEEAGQGREPAAVR
jgi:excisionase family DNA binding protein